MKDIKSIRIKNIHFALQAGESSLELHPQEFPSINKAKAHSKVLGGMSAVRAFRSKDEAYDFLRTYEKEKTGTVLIHLNGQTEEFAMAAAEEEKANGSASA